LIPVLTPELKYNVWLKKRFELAMTRTKKLCCVDKANVMETSRLWRETVQAMEKDYPEVTSYEFVDAVAMRLVQWPNL
jgi:3-isopropylmalate dehydrogenase